MRLDCKRGAAAAVSTLVAMLAASGCARDEPPRVEAADPPAPAAPVETIEPAEAAPATNATQAAVDQVRGRAAAQSAQNVQSAAPEQSPRRLVFECRDGVTFAVRMGNGALHLYPPGYPPNGYLSLSRVTGSTGAHFRAGDLEFRSEGDRATLTMGRARYAECVANPAAAVWQELERPDTATR